MPKVIKIITASILNTIILVELNILKILSFKIFLQLSKTASKLSLEFTIFFFFLLIKK